MGHPRNTPYDQDDLKSVVEEIEGFKAAEEDTKAEAKATREDQVKKAKNRAKQLNIPNDILTATLKKRELQRKTAAAEAKIVGSVKEDHLELFEESSGQLSWFQPDEGKPALDTMQNAIEERRKAIQEKTDEELAEGEQVLEDLTAGEKVH